MDSSVIQYNSDSWENCEIRTYIMPQFESALPPDLQVVLKEITKYTDNSGAGNGNVTANVTATAEKCFLLNEQEVGLTRYANSYESNYTKQYDFFTSANDRKRYDSDQSTAVIWWLRSPRANAANYCCAVSESGGNDNENAVKSYGIAPAFVVG